MVMTCDICGGKLTAAQDGTAACEACGKEYSAEVVCKKQAALDTEVSSAAIKASKAQISSYLNLCELSVDAGDYAKVALYAEKLIMTAPKNAEAWFLKGKAACRQYTGADTRLSEAVGCWVTAISFCDTEEEKVGLRSRVAKEFIATVENTVTSLAAEFEDSPSSAVKNEIYNTTIIDYFTLRGKLTSSGSIDFGDLDEFDNTLAKKLYEGAKEAVAEAKRDHGFGKSVMSEENYHQWLEKNECCQKVFEYSMTLATDETFVETVFRDIKSLQEAEIRACDEQFETNSLSSDRYWTDLEKGYRQKVISDMTAKKDELIASICRKREEKKITAEENEERLQELAEYRQAHPEIKTELEAGLESVQKEKEELEAKADELKEKIADVRKKASAPISPSKESIELEEDLEDANNELAMLGVFAFKKKKKLQQKIDGLTEKKKALETREILDRQKRIKYIEDDCAALESELKDYEDMIDDCCRLTVTIKEKLKNI